jgi:putative nucleotidyltransferase with HDIG domain
MDKTENLVGKIETLPASPALLPRLAQLLNDFTSTDVGEIVDIIVFDSALTAKLLQIANSAYFGSPTPISTPGEAINRLGYDTVFLLAASISGENTIKTKPGTGLDAVLLWKHSVYTAFGTQNIIRTRGQDGNLGFTAGLLHDVGKIVLSEKHGPSYTSMFDPTKRGPVTLIQWEKEQYGSTHAEVGATLLQKWKLPASLIAGVKFHHHPAAAGNFAPLAACISLGNAMSHTFEKPDFEMDPADPQLQAALKIVGLNMHDLKGHWNDIREKWELVQALCNLRK